LRRADGYDDPLGGVAVEAHRRDAEVTHNKLQMGLMNPTVATVNSVDTVVRYSSAQITLNIHPEATLQERKDLLAYCVNFFTNATVKTSVENIEPFY
jgi:hypothetical protein